MKQIVCEMCGSNKMIKKDGVYECQYCGCQYTVEEARKLMVEGTVKIDESDKVDNWLKLADSAYNNSSWREAYSYYCKVLEVYPEEWRATYRKALSIGWQSTLGNIHATEAVGGIADGVRALLSSDNTDEYKALGILTMEQDLFAWVSAVQSASVNHAAEYTKKLESACYDYYQRSAVMASVIEFAISLLNKYTVMNIEDLDLADGVFNVIIKASSTISTALSSRFRPLVGKKYNSFLQVFVDDYRDVYPTEAASNAYSKLRIATEKMKQEYPQWKHARLLRDDPDYDNRIMYEAALKKKAADDIKSLEAAVALLGKTTGYKDSESLAAECKERILEKKYTAAVEKKNSGKGQSLNEAVIQFEEISNYKDSAALASECKERLEELTSKKAQIRKRLKTVGIAVLIIFLLIDTIISIKKAKKENDSNKIIDTTEVESVKRDPWDITDEQAVLKEKVRIIGKLLGMEAEGIAIPEEVQQAMDSFSILGVTGQFSYSYGDDFFTYDQIARVQMVTWLSEETVDDSKQYEIREWLADIYGWGPEFTGEIDSEEINVLDSESNIIVSIENEDGRMKMDFYTTTDGEFILPDFIPCDLDGCSRLGKYEINIDVNFRKTEI